MHLIFYYYFFYFGIGLDTRLVALSNREYEFLIRYVGFGKSRATLSVLSTSILSDLESSSGLLFEGANSNGRCNVFFERLWIKRGLLKIDICNRKFEKLKILPIPSPRWYSLLELDVFVALTC